MKQNDYFVERIRIEEILKGTPGEFINPLCHSSRKGFCTKSQTP